MQKNIPSRGNSQGRDPVVFLRKCGVAQEQKESQCGSIMVKEGREQLGMAAAGSHTAPTCQATQVNPVSSLPLQTTSQRRRRCSPSVTRDLVSSNSPSPCSIWDTVTRPLPDF